MCASDSVLELGGFAGESGAKEPGGGCAYGWIFQESRETVFGG